jgi:hypothetical protein
MMKTLIDGLIGWPERTARHLEWLAPLFARIVVGWVFLWSGLGKLSNLPATTENFISWGIPFSANSHPVCLGSRVLRRHPVAAWSDDPHFRGGLGRYHDRCHQVREVGSGGLPRDLPRVRRDGVPCVVSLVGDRGRGIDLHRLAAEACGAHPPGAVAPMPAVATQLRATDRFTKLYQAHNHRTRRLPRMAA